MEIPYKIINILEYTFILRILTFPHTESHLSKFKIFLCILFMFKVIVCKRSQDLYYIYYKYESDNC